MLDAVAECSNGVILAAGVGEVDPSSSPFWPLCSRGDERFFFYKSAPARCLGNVEDLTIWSRETQPRFSGLDWMQERSTSGKQSSSSRSKMKKLAAASGTQSTLYSSKPPPFL